MEQKQRQRQREKEQSFLVIGCKCVVERLDRKRGKSNGIDFPWVSWKLVFLIDSFVLCAFGSVTTRLKVLI